MTAVGRRSGIGAAGVCFAAFMGCAAGHGKETAMLADRTLPDIGALSSAPLRNRIRVRLEAGVPEVWALIGDLSRFPEYSSGLERVEARTDADGRCTEYLCRFKPQAPGGEGVAHREIVRWFEPRRGYASSGEKGNAFGLTNDLNLVAVEPSGGGTLLTWSEYFDAPDLETMKASYDAALADIGENLVRRFGGRIVERYVEGRPGTP